MRTLHCAAQRLRNIVGSDDFVGHRPLFIHIVHRAHVHGLAGACVFRGVEGFGAAQQIHTTRILSLAEDMPMYVVIVDTADRIAAFLLELDLLVGEGLAMLDDVQVVRHIPCEPAR